MEKNVYFPKVQDIEKASERLKEILAPTPLQLNAHFSNKYGCDVYLKREDLQMVRSYKIRGAYNKIRSIQPEVLKYGIDAHDQVQDPKAPATAQLTQILKPVTGAISGLTVAGLAAMFGLAIGYKRDKLAYNPETEDTVSVITGDVVQHGDPQDDKTVMEHITENLPIGKKGDK